MEEEYYTHKAVVMFDSQWCLNIIPVLRYTRIIIERDLGIHLQVNLIPYMFEYDDCTTKNYTDKMINMCLAIDKSLLKECDTALLFVNNTNTSLHGISANNLPGIKQSFAVVQQPPQENIKLTIHKIIEGVHCVCHELGHIFGIEHSKEGIMSNCSYEISHPLDLEY